MSSHVLIHVTTPPSPDCEAMEYALAMSAFDLPVRILFSGKGNYWLLPGQKPRREGCKNPEKLLSALPVYGIEEVAYLPENERILSSSQYGKATPISHEQATDWIRSSHHTVTF